MVLDESALEAMLARQRAAERDHEQATSVRTVKTDEFEVYERQPTPPAENGRTPPPEQANAAHHQSGPHDLEHNRGLDMPQRPTGAREVQRPPASAFPPRPAPHTAPPEADDFEELPGREAESATPATWSSNPPRYLDAPVTPRGPTSADPGTVGPGTTASSGRATPTPGGSQRSPRRPQVWPPIGRQEAVPAPETPPGVAPAPSEAVAPSLADDVASPGAPAPPMWAQADAAADVPTDAGPSPVAHSGGGVHADATRRSHAPTPHAFPERSLDGSGCRIAIIQAMFNQEITDAMVAEAVARARSAGAETSVHQVPGVYDLPLVVQHLARRKDVDAIVVIGCVVRGETKHDELITFTTAKTLQEICLATDTPVALGITGPGMTWQQAQARIGNGAHAVEAAIVQWRTLQTV